MSDLSQLKNGTLTPVQFINKEAAAIKTAASWFGSTPLGKEVETWAIGQSKALMIKAGVPETVADMIVNGVETALGLLPAAVVAGVGTTAAPQL